MKIEKFDPFMAQVQELVNQKVDSEDIASVKDKKKKLQKTRGEVTKFGKSLRDEANAFNKSVLVREKEILSLIEPEEEKLDVIIEEHKKIEERKEREALLPDRKEKLALIGDGIEVSDEAILDMDGTTFMGYMNKRVADKNEKDRLEIVRQQAEVREAEQKIQREKEKAEAVEKARVDAEKKAEKDKADALALAEKQKQDAIAKVEKEKADAIAKIKQEQKDAEDKLAKEKADQEAEAQRIAEEQKKDVGHDSLIIDLEALLQDAREYAFHDFKNEKPEIPKVALYNRLLELAQSVKEGKYDNK